MSVGTSNYSEYDSDELLYVLSDELGNDVGVRLEKLENNCFFFRFNEKIYISFVSPNGPIYSITENGLEKFTGSTLPPACTARDFFEFAPKFLDNDIVRLFLYVEEELEAYKRGDFEKYLQIEKAYNSKKFTCYFDGKVLMINNSLSDLDESFYLFGGRLIPIIAANGINLDDFVEIPLSQFFTIVDEFKLAEISDIFRDLATENIVIEEKLELSNDFTCFRLGNEYIISIQNSDGSRIDYCYNDRDQNFSVSDISPNVLEKAKFLNSDDVVNKMVADTGYTKAQLVKYISGLRK